MCYIHLFKGVAYPLWIKCSLLLFFESRSHYVLIKPYLCRSHQLGEAWMLCFLGRTSLYYNPLGPEKNTYDVHTLMNKETEEAVEKSDCASVPTIQSQNIVDDYKLGPLEGLLQFHPLCFPNKAWVVELCTPAHLVGHHNMSGSPHLNCTSSYYRVLTYLSLFSCPDQSLLFWLIGSISINSLSCMHYTYYCLALFLSVQSLLGV